MCWAPRTPLQVKLCLAGGGVVRNLGTSIFVTASLFLSLPFAPSTEVATPTPASQNETEQVTATTQASASNVGAPSIQAQPTSGGTNITFRVGEPQVKPETTKPTDASAPAPRPSVIKANGKTYPNRVYQPLLTPNDPNGTQWWTTNTGLNNAWNSGTGTTGPIIAIIDTGFALSHEEFTGRWYVSPTETLNGLDDDANGYIDDTTGWDFISNDRLPRAGQVNPNGNATTHGTLVAGIAAANGNNNRGIAGVNWGARILPLQVISDDGYGDTYGVAQAVRYAADRGAAVINLSLGASEEDPFLREAIAYAITKGSLVVAAAGNDGCDCMSYPARYPEVIAVGAYDSNGQRSSFSSYGSALDIMAPGNTMLTSTWQPTNTTTAYEYAAGTSLASPFVSGLLALGRSHQPNASWSELVGIMLEKSDHRGMTAAAPRTNIIGFGYSKADGFVARLLTAASPVQRNTLGKVSALDVLTSQRIHQCETGAYPSLPLYRLTRAAEIRFTSSEQERYQKLAAGWTSIGHGYHCAGLPTDTPQSVRVINLHQELLNINNKSY